MGKVFLSVVKVSLIVLIVFALVSVSLWYLEEKGYIENIFQDDEAITGYTGYGGYGDPCYYEPGEPDPCGGS